MATDGYAVLGGVMADWREFRLIKGKKVQVWKIRNLGTKYETEHGLLNGAMQNFSDAPGDKGKTGSKAYVSEKDNTAFHIEREIRKKEEHGYIEYIDGKPSAIQVTEISFDKALPKNFCGYKPQTSIEDKALEKLHKTGKARYTRKMDGMMHLAVYHSWGWEIYTRRMDLASERFPNHIKALENTSYDVGTILVGEMVCLKDKKEDFKDISRVCRSLPEETRKLVEDGEVPEPKYVVFDILFHNNKDLKNTSYDDRAKLWNSFYEMNCAVDDELICKVDYYGVSPETWEKKAKDNGWEGFVITDGDSIPGDKFYSFDGDAKRPKGHHKLKPCFSEEAVVFAASEGSGKRLGGIGAVHVKQLMPNSTWHYCGKIGSGFCDADLDELEKLCKKNNISILSKDKDVEKIDLTRTDGLFTIELEFGDRQPGTQKFRFPVFLRLRPDKKVEECFAQRLAKDEE